MISEEDEESWWEEHVQSFIDHDGEDTEEGPKVSVQDNETTETREEDEEQYLRQAKPQITQRITRSVFKRRVAATSVEKPAAKRPRRVIIHDSDEASDQVSSEEEQEEEEEDDLAGDDRVEEEEFEAVDDPQVNARAVFQYNIRGRSPFWENGFSTAMKYPPFIQRVMDHYGWADLCRQPEGTSMGMVRAFYRNFDEEAFVSEVRGININASQAEINRIYGLVGGSERVTLRRIFDPTVAELNAALRTVAIPGTIWRISPRGHRTLRHRDIKPRLQTWLYFIKKRLLQTSHDTTVSPDRVMLLYSIRRLLPINVGAIIAHTMADCLTRIRGRLLYPSLIGRLCIAAGVDCADLGQRCRVLKPIDLELILELEGTRAARMRDGDIDIPDRHTLTDADFSSPEREVVAEEEERDNDEPVPTSPVHSAPTAHRSDPPLDHLQRPQQGLNHRHSILQS